MSEGRGEDDEEGEERDVGAHQSFEDRHVCDLCFTSFYGVVVKNQILDISPPTICLLRLKNVVRSLWNSF